MLTADDYFRLDMLLSRSVLLNASYLFDRLLADRPGDEDLLRLTQREDYEEPARDWMNDNPDDEDDKEAFLAAEEDGDWTDFCQHRGIEPRYSEVFEHYIVGERFAEHLAEQGEVVAEIEGLWFWGRCTTGQSITLDSVIENIAREMGVLEGQKYEWKV